MISNRHREKLSTKTKREILSRVLKDYQEFVKQTGESGDQEREDGGKQANPGTGNCLSLRC